MNLFPKQKMQDFALYKNIRLPTSKGKEKSMISDLSVQKIKKKKFFPARNTFSLFHTLLLNHSNEHFNFINTFPHNSAHSIFGVRQKYHETFLTEL